MSRPPRRCGTSPAPDRPPGRRPPLKRRIRFFLPALGYMGLTMALSGRPAPELAHSAPVLLGISSLHIVEFALLALLWIHALRRGTALSRSAAYAGTVVICALWGIQDEIHQSFHPQRTAEAADVVSDVLGGAVGVLLHSSALALRARRRQRHELTCGTPPSSGRTPGK